MQIILNQQGFPISGPQGINWINEIKMYYNIALFGSSNIHCSC